MLKLLVLILVSLPGYSSTLLLEKHQSISHGEAIARECKIYAEGFMESLTTRGNGTAVDTTQKVSKVSIKAMKVLAHLAGPGAIVEAGIPCEAGTRSVKVHTGSSEIELESTVECVSKRTNNSSASRVLLSMTESICAF
jgi:hypothetical protein